ncbi:hypothetical protein B0H10DRAFT_2216893 [Mycena sp. CBHHK59/15]|nr:hypothetical protein B0H10DRAFT_2216893 [Mycena sp. CBHHK59/15]
MSISDSEPTESSVEDDSDMPGLQSVSDSEESDDDLEIPFPGAANETWGDRMASIAHAFNKWNLTQKEKPARGHQLGDILGMAAHSMLEFLQPYPGDELIPRSDPRRKRTRFEVM